MSNKNKFLIHRLWQEFLVWKSREAELGEGDSFANIRVAYRMRQIEIKRTMKALIEQDLEQAMIDDEELSRSIRRRVNQDISRELMQRLQQMMEDERQRRLALWREHIKRLDILNRHWEDMGHRVPIDDIIRAQKLNFEGTGAGDKVDGVPLDIKRAQDGGGLWGKFGPGSNLFGTLSTVVTTLGSLGTGFAATGTAIGTGLALLSGHRKAEAHEIKRDSWELRRFKQYIHYLSLWFEEALQVVVRRPDALRSITMPFSYEEWRLSH